MTTSRDQKVHARDYRRAAIKRLKAERGISVRITDSTDDHIAALIQRVEPGLHGEPALIIRAWLATKPDEAVKPREKIAPKRAYSPSADGRMAAVMARLGDTPKPTSMTSKVPNSLMGYR